MKAAKISWDLNTDGGKQKALDHIQRHADIQRASGESSWKKRWKKTTSEMGGCGVTEAKERGSQGEGRGQWK